MAKHQPFVIWPLQKIGKYPQIYLSTVDEKTIKFEYYPLFGHDGISFLVSRRQARLLAKRLNQVLDETTK